MKLDLKILIVIIIFMINSKYFRTLWYPGNLYEGQQLLKRKPIRIFHQPTYNLHLLMEGQPKMVLDTNLAYLLRKNPYNIIK